jgi:hypothetical protein
LRQRKRFFVAIKIKNLLKSKTWFDKKIPKVSQKAKNKAPRQPAYPSQVTKRNTLRNKMLQLGHEKNFFWYFFKPNLPPRSKNLVQYSQPPKLGG